ncbi:LOW QUALITY PROTEIN: hypothetical protein PHMEG_0001489 [Phytophthora megakarya]|uniref:Uncharacterized protein n=1 Tax=Phytophthora megakarya TaxID=4795 RepID=A0A225X155_9STRA|nr:LOW QUALITY PROTEIN: hypothetical protein PHMEG_0001489 [Phytophthora megakarya]
MAIELGNWLVVPAKSQDHAIFFQELKPWIENHDTRDVSIVYYAQGRKSLTKTKFWGGAVKARNSKSLVENYELTDAVDLNHDIEGEDDEPDPFITIRFGDRMVQAD